MNRSIDAVTALRSLTEVPVDTATDRLDAIEARVRAAIEDDTPDRATVLLLPPRRSRARTGLAAAAAVLAIAVGAVLVGGRDDAIVIAAADGVSVTLEDGTVIEGVVDLELTDGTVLDVSGFVVIDGDRFGPGRYLIIGGEVEQVDDQPSPPTRPATGEGVSDRPPGSVAPAATTDGPPTETTAAVERAPGTVDAADRPSVPTAEDGPTATRPRATDGSDATDPTRPERTTVPSTSPATDAPHRSTTVASTRPATTTPPTRPTTMPAPTTTSPDRTTIPERDR